MAVASAEHRRTWPPHAPQGAGAQLVLGVVGMMIIAAALFAWPLVREAPGVSLAEKIAATENAFAAFIFAETIFVPLEGWLGERFPRAALVASGCTLVAVGVVASVGAEGATARMAWSALGGAGAGLVYGGTVAKALKRFTDRKAVCVGVTSAACAGVILLAAGAVGVLSSARSIPLLILLGAGQAAVILVATLTILYPSAAEPPSDW